MTQLTVPQLFQPAPSGVGPFGNVPLNPVAGSWLQQMLTVAAQVQLPTTAWQSGQPERTILAIEAVQFASSDIDISIMAQGGFLGPAATGTVASTLTDGTVVIIPVTPDPSNTAQNPTGALGWLDLLGSNVYDTDRLEASYATGPLAIAKVTAGSSGPYAVGSYHVAATTGATYRNTAALTIPSSIIAGTGGVITAVTPGLTSTAITTQSAHGLTAGDSVYLVVPVTSGVSGLVGVFALVTSATSTTFVVSRGSAGTWVSGGNVYKATVATMVADLAGSVSSAGPGQVDVTVTQQAGVFVSNVIAWSGAAWESNQAYADRCLLSLASRSPNGPSQAYAYFAQSAVQILAGSTANGLALRTALGLPAYTLTNGPVRAEAFSVPATGVVNTVVASTSPIATALGAAVTPGVAQLPVSNVSNTNPAVVTCTAPTSLATGESMTVTISGVEGISGINGTWVGTYTAADAFSIPVDSTSSGTYTGGGQVEGGDLGQIDALIQRACVPDNTTAVTTSAVALPISVVATVVVPQAYVEAYRIAVVSQLQAQIAAYAIGGNAPTYEVGYDDIVGALEEAGVQTLGSASVVRQVQSLSLNGFGADVGVPFPSPFYEAILVIPTITVVGI
jgi:hypothetical protein